MSSIFDIISIGHYSQYMPRDVKNTLMKIRLERSMTQEILAERVGVSRQTIISIEKGKYRPSIALALEIAHTFGMQVEDLFYLS